MGARSLRGRSPASSRAGSVGERARRKAPGPPDAVMRRAALSCALLVFAAAVAAADASGDARLLGLNIHQSADVGVAVTEVCKGQLVRVDFNWFSAEPTEGTYDWTVLDAVVNASVARGFTVIATTGYTPA